MFQLQDSLAYNSLFWCLERNYVFYHSATDTKLDLALVMPLHPTLQQIIAKTKVPDSPFPFECLLNAPW